MEFMDVVKKRRSIRKYKPDRVPKAEIEYVLEAARLAPSWANRQCWRYIVVTDEATRKRITMTEWAAKAPVVIVACGDPSKAGNRDGKPYYMLDMGISMEHLVLAASEHGLGTCWLGGQFDEKTVREALGVPESHRIVAMTPLGYPDESPPAKERKPLPELATWEKW
ncbi:TPA: nitroreductase [Candidatus Bathyarchaeota archaeon]|nr:nitroreductase [Candidatus Bathyarchaeota archaeon]